MSAYCEKGPDIKAIMCPTLHNRLQDKQLYSNYHDPSHNIWHEAAFCIVFTNYLFRVFMIFLRDHEGHIVQSCRKVRKNKV